LAHGLTGDDEHGILTAVTTYLEGTGWAVIREPITSGATGYATADGSRRVVIEAGLEPAMAAKTALHEAAHVTIGHTEADHADGV
jgi:hypothetical protein